MALGVPATVIPSQSASVDRRWRSGFRSESLFLLIRRPRTAVVRYDESSARPLLHRDKDPAPRIRPNRAKIG